MIREWAWCGTWMQDIPRRSRLRRKRASRFRCCSTIKLPQSHEVVSGSSFLSALHLSSRLQGGPMYVILGATGNTGSVIANVLLDMGKKVRVVGRDAKKLAPFVSRGAQAF